MWNHHHAPAVSRVVPNHGSQTAAVSAARETSQTALPCQRQNPAIQDTTLQARGISLTLDHPSTEPQNSVCSAPRHRLLGDEVSHPQHQEGLWAGTGSASSTDRAITQHAPYPLALARATGATWCAQPKVTGSCCLCAARGY